MTSSPPWRPHLPAQLVELALNSPEAIFDLLAERGLDDGLAAVAPTPQRVDAMLAHADGDPDECYSPSSPGTTGPFGAPSPGGLACARCCC